MVQSKKNNNSALLVNIHNNKRHVCHRYIGMQAHYVLTTLRSAFSGVAIRKKTDRQILMTNCTAIREKKICVYKNNEVGLTHNTIHYKITTRLTIR